VFHGLPAAAVDDARRLSGRWSCHLTDPGAAGLAFTLELRFEGGRPAGTVGAGVVQEGALHGGELRLVVRDGRVSYRLTARLRDGRLRGTFELDASGEGGAWEGERVEPDMHLSEALVDLWEHVGPGGARRHDTRRDTLGPGWTCGAIPVCRVWRSPQSLLIVEPGARPAP
jgi:hypothetical protein